MKITKYMPLIVAVAALTATSCRHEANELAHDHAHHAEENGVHEDGDDHEDHDSEHGDSHDGEIILSPERAKELGVDVTEVAPGTFSGVIEVAGQLSASPADQSTVAARSAGLLTFAPGITEGAQVSRGRTIATVTARAMAGGDVNETNRIALEAAKRELDRLTPLAEEGIVTRRDYNAARQRYDEARAAVASGAGKSGSAAVAPTSGTITALLATEGQYVDAGQPIATISGTSTVTLRADLPERYASSLSSISGATFRTAYDQTTHDIADYRGSMTGRPTGATATGGYIPVYYTLHNDGSLIPGSYCTVYLHGESRDNIFTVPVESVTEQQGVKFVYIREHADAYRKQPVTIGANDGRNIEITSGLKAGDRVVTSGTTFVRLAETSGVVPEGHKHNH